MTMHDDDDDVMMTMIIRKKMARWMTPDIRRRVGSGEPMRCAGDPLVWRFMAKFSRNTEICQGTKQTFAVISELTQPKMTELPTSASCELAEGFAFYFLDNLDLK